MKTRDELMNQLGSLAQHKDKVVLEAILDLRELLRDIKVELQKEGKR